MPQNKSIFVYGAGISGCGVAEVLSAKGEKVILFNDVVKELPLEFIQKFKEHNGLYICGEDGAKYLEDVYLFIVSPGISIHSSLIQIARQKGIEVIGEVEEAMRLYRGKLIGITGTNGKTTTTTLVGEMIKTLPVKSEVGGNIGFALSTEVDGLNEQDWLVAELSSFQLESVTSLKPNIAAVLNITQDHLDRHSNMEGYTEAKSNIFKNQTDEDFLVLNLDDPLVAALAERSKSKVCFISRKKILAEGVFVENEKFIIVWDEHRIEVCAIEEMKLFGGHNVENALVAIACAFLAGVKIEDIKRVLISFIGVEHRIEYVETLKGVPYYNDSKATNPDSTIKALEAFAGHIILIAGGRDKNTDLTEMMQLIKERTDALILLGEAKERFLQAAQKAGVSNIYEVTSLEEAVNTAYKLATEPQVVLLSPACASYDMFNNFPERGNCFKKLVVNLK